MVLFDKRLFAHANWGLIITTLLLMVAGLINLYSASSVRTEDGYYVQAFFQQQIIWYGIGFIVLMACCSLDYKHYKLLAIPILFLALTSLALVPLIGVSVNNSQRWLSLGFMRFQPSEIAKISTILMGALLISRHNAKLSWLNILEVLAVCLIPCFLILIQPDLGTTLNLLLIIGSMILFQGVKTSVLISSAIAMPIALFVGWFYMHDYQRERILAFINPDTASAKSIYQVMQSKITIGSGQVWGNTFMEGTQSKLRFLPEKHTDFAIAVFCEDWGFFGSAILISLFCLFLFFIVKTTKESKDRFGSLICAGVFFYFFWQILINIGMVVGIMPVVGIPLPFISYGGTATLVNFFMLSLVLNISMRKFMFKIK